ncbi:hypothetical protein FD755_015520 [Muntiacus reevesi]|uniref:Uncharacterized protein n=1 Tax=Muntiacus reevesi TaxID=9886 RepID=A0A5N3XI57_MUNRE|nr:hypothetical protein FD755_015520 [Muntiacus reevesi]
MARDLIGPALPPGFKAGGSAEDEERDSSPGKRRRVTLPPAPPAQSLAWPWSRRLGGRTPGEWARPGPN